MDEIYGRNGRGQITSIFAGHHGSTAAISYDGFGRLAGVSGNIIPATYAYDAAGNMTQNSRLCLGGGVMTYPAPGQALPHTPAKICDAIPTYDLAGKTVTPHKFNVFIRRQSIRRSLSIAPLSCSQPSAQA